MADGSIQIGTFKQGKRILVRYRRPTKNNTRFPVNRLPYCAMPRGGGRVLWAMPASDGYGTGCDMGKAAAQAFMKALRASNSDSSTLQHVVFDLINSGFDFNSENGRKGQVVGFFSYLDAWLRSAACLIGSTLDEVSERDIEEAMTLAANESEAENSARFQKWLDAKYGAGREH